MLRHQGYRFRLRGLDAAQRTAIASEAGKCRWLYNAFVQFDLERHEAGKKLPGFKWRCRALAFLRNHPDYAWLAEGSSPAQQRTLRNLSDAWTRYFEDRKLPTAQRRGVKPPVFKKKGEHDAVGWSGRQHIQIDPGNGRVRLPKIGWVRYRNCRKVRGDAVNATISRVGIHWDVSLGTEREVSEPASRRHVAPIGLDLGIAHLATTSEGDHLRGPRALRTAAKKLAKAQRIQARRKKGSQQRKRQSWKVGKIMRRVANVRRDCSHKLTTELAKNHGFVGVEALRVAPMSASAAGTALAPGKNVRAKSGLNREILDQGWGEMRRQLAYKLSWSGGVLVAVDPRNTSRRCSACGHTSRDNRTSQANFACVSCGHAMNADVNAAKNILAAAMAAAPVGVDRQERRGRRRYRAAIEPCKPAFTAGIPAL